MNKVFRKGKDLFWISSGLILLCAVAALDFLTGPELSFSLFYLIPIAIVGLGTNWKYGLAMAFLSGVIWLFIEFSYGPAYSSSFIYYWNAGVRIAYFMIFVLFIRLSKSLQIEKDVARTDFLTGAYNTRYFHELAQIEIERSARYNHSLAIAFIDLDNFKTVNDKFGHSVGDEALATVANNLRESLRKTDIIARVGGDEFAILMPEADEEAVQAVMIKVQASLSEEMERRGWPITLSIGAMTFNVMPESADIMLNMADKLMYTVKNSSKNNISYAVYPESEMDLDLQNETEILTSK